MKNEKPPYIKVLSNRTGILLDVVTGTTNPDDPKEWCWDVLFRVALKPPAIDEISDNYVGKRALLEGYWQELTERDIQKIATLDLANNLHNWEDGLGTKKDRITDRITEGDDTNRARALYELHIEDEDRGEIWELVNRLERTSD